MKLVKALRENGYAVSVIDVKGKNEGDKHLLFIEINKQTFNQLKNIVKEVDPNAFIVVNETKFVQNGYIK